jgi:hypothetical protein
MRLVLAALLVSIGAVAWAADPMAAYNAARASAPADVAAYMERRVRCWHWSGEEPYDADRRKQIDDAMTKLKCDTIDADDAALRRKYAGSPSALAALDLVKNGFE